MTEDLKIGTPFNSTPENQVAEKKLHKRLTTIFLIETSTDILYDNRQG